MHCPALRLSDSAANVLLLELRRQTVLSGARGRCVFKQAAHSRVASSTSAKRQCGSQRRIASVAYNSLTASSRASASNGVAAREGSSLAATRTKAKLAFRYSPLSASAEPTECAGEPYRTNPNRRPFAWLFKLQSYSVFTALKSPLSSSVFSGPAG